MAKYIFTLISDDYGFEKDTLDLLEILGIATVYKGSEDFYPFMYEFKP